MRFFSPIQSEIDFDADGRQEGFLRLPYSVHRSAYGWLPIPAISIRNGDGPKVVLMAGNHGDEYEGQVALTKLSVQLSPSDVTGQIIILPMANMPAAKAGLRTSPLDQGNLNRSFPGDAAGSPTQIIAHYLEHVVFQDVDFMLDLHSGGSSLEHLPTALVERGSTTQARATRRQIIDALGLPYVLLFESSDDGPFATSAVSRQGGIGITTELGGSGMVSPAIMNLIDSGLRRYLKLVGVCPRMTTEPSVGKARFFYVGDDSHYVFSRADGVFEPMVELGEFVETGQTVAFIHTPETPWAAPTPVTLAGDGFVICKRAIARTQTGDCLFQLGTPPPADFFPTD